jgi:hypothetical protein
MPEDWRDLVILLENCQGFLSDLQRYLPVESGNGSFRPMKRKKDSRVTMKEGDRILINKGISRKVMIIARVEIPHSNERIFVTKSGGKYTIGLKVWKSDYAWSDKNQMWVPKR